MDVSVLDVEGSYHPMVSRSTNELLLPNNIDANAVSSFSSSSNVGQVSMSMNSKQCDIGSSAVSKVLCNSDIHPNLQYSCGFDSNNSQNSVMPKDMQVQRKYSRSPQELKGKACIASSSNSVPHQVDTVVSTFSMGNSVMEKRLYGDVSQGSVEATPKTVHSDSSRNVTNMYRRRSPTGSHQQHFLNPGLPLAKSLTESVQKVVKALPSIENSTLPHQRKSPLNSSCKVSCSSSPSKPAKVSESRSSVIDSLTVKQTIPLSSAAVISEMDMSNSGEFDNSLHGFSEHSTSSQGIEKLLLLQNNAPLPVLEIESSHELEFSNVPLENHLGVEIDCKQNFHDTKSQSLLDKSKPSSQDSFIKGDKSSSSVEFCDNEHELTMLEQSAQRTSHTDSVDKVISKTLTTSDSTSICEPVTKESQIENDKTLNSDHLDIKTDSCVKDDKVSTEITNRVNHLQSKLSDAKRVDDTNPSYSKNHDTKIVSPKSSSKSSKGNGEVNFKGKRLEEKDMEVTVVTKVTPSEQRQQDKAEPTVPPIIIRMRKSNESSDASKAIPEVLAANSEESHLSMTLRGKSTAKSPEEAVHNLRKPQKQSALEPTDLRVDKNAEKDSNKNVISDDESLKRNLRKRKCASNDGEPEAKKPVLETEEVAKHTRSNDLKDCNTVSVTSKKADTLVLQKLEDETETSPVVDGVKSGLRARSNTKTAEEKQKGAVVKEVKKLKAEDENFLRNKQVFRQKKLSPTVPPERPPASGKDK